jgi:acyl-CoA thioester hydrolase
MPDERFRFSTSLEVRWRDLDSMGHVNNAVYFTYLEQARVHYLHELSILSSVPSDVGFIIASTSCQYKYPLSLGEQVTIYARVSEMRNSSFVFDYLIEGKAGKLAATARTVQVCYDYENGHSISIPDDWRQAIVAYEPKL